MHNPGPQAEVQNDFQKGMPEALTALAKYFHMFNTCIYAQNDRRFVDFGPEKNSIF